MNETTSFFPGPRKDDRAGMRSGIKSLVDTANYLCYCLSQRERIATHLDVKQQGTLMKSTYCLILALILSAIAVFAADSVSVEPGVSSYNIIHLPVLKVFAAKEGEHRFLAYLVKWNGSEVIVSDVLARSAYKVGDSIPIVVMKTGLDQKDGSKIYTLSFTVGRPDD